MSLVSLPSGIFAGLSLTALYVCLECTMSDSCAPDRGFLGCPITSVGHGAFPSSVGLMSLSSSALTSLDLADAFEEGASELSILFVTPRVAGS